MYVVVSGLTLSFQHCLLLAVSPSHLLRFLFSLSRVCILPMVAYFVLSLRPLSRSLLVSRYFALLTDLISVFVAPVSFRFFSLVDIRNIWFRCLVRIFGLWVRL